MEAALSCGLTNTLQCLTKQQIADGNTYIWKKDANASDETIAIYLTFFDVFCCKNNFFLNFCQNCSMFLDKTSKEECVL